jgi:hypothetical protein
MGFRSRMSDVKVLVALEGMNRSSELGGYARI